MLVAVRLLGETEANHPQLRSIHARPEIQTTILLVLSPHFQVNASERWYFLWCFFDSSISIMTVIPVMTPHHLENSQEVDQQAEYKKRKKKKAQLLYCGLEKNRRKLNIEQVRSFAIIRLSILV